MITLPSVDVAWALAATYALLLVASLAAAGLMRWRQPRIGARLTRGLRAGFLTVTLFAAALLLTRDWALVYLGILGFLALKEYFSLIPLRRADRRVLFWTYLAIPVQFVLIGQGLVLAALLFVPLVMLLLLPAAMIGHGDTPGFVRAAGTLHWGLMSAIYGLGASAAVLVEPVAADRAAGAGLLLLLVLLVLLGELARAVAVIVTTRRSHRRGRDPAGRTAWAAGTAGLVACTALALAVGPWLGGLDRTMAALAGALVGLTGAIGDAVIAAIRRDLALEDSGSLLPGHGALLFRIDRLTFTAPAFLLVVAGGDVPAAGLGFGT